MRSLRLARIAAEAEGVRLRAMAARIVTRIICAVIAMFFLLGTIAFMHLAAWYEVRNGLYQSYLATAGILGGVDLVLAASLGFLATRSKPNKVETEARDVRRRALEGIGDTLSLTQMAIQIMRPLSDLLRRKRR